MEYKIPVYQRVDIPLKADGKYKNLFKETEVYADFVHDDGTVIRQYGFFKGENAWCIRFAPVKEGAYRFKTVSGDIGLNGIEGTVIGTLNAPRHELDRHGWVRLEEGKHYFVYEDGTPFFWLGDTHWQMPDYERIHRCNYPGCDCGNQFKHVADDRIKKGFTVYQTYFSSGRRTADAEKEILPWWLDEYETINVEAFEKADYMLSYLAEHGVTIALGFGLHSQTMMQMKGNEEALLLFVKYCVARYSAFPIIWITAQEITQPAYGGFAAWLKVGELVGRLDGYHHPNGAHMYPFDAEHPTVKTTGDQPWHQYYLLQAGHGAMARFKDRFFYKSYYDLPVKKVYIEGECQYEDIYYKLQNDSDSNRKGAWQAMLSGCGGFTYGVTGIWALSWGGGEKSGFDSYNPEPWYIGLHKHGALELGYMKEFLLKFPFWRMEPLFGDIGSFEQRKLACAARIDDESYVYYFLDETHETGCLRRLKPLSTYNGYWFDVCTGKYISAGQLNTDAAGMAEIPRRPTPRDWVFVATRLTLTDVSFEKPPVCMPQPYPDISVLGKRSLIKAIKASSFDRAHPIGNVLDGQEDTYWQPYSDVTCQTIDIELDTPQDGGYLYMKVLNPEVRYYNYRIWGSNDGVNYDLVQDVSGGIQKNVSTDGAHPFHIRELLGNYKYIRFFINSNFYKTPIQISGLEIYRKK